MSDSFSTVSDQSWFSRMKNAVIGVVIGIIMIPGAVALLGWNEYRTIHRTQGLKQGAKTVVTVSDPGSVDDGLNEQLVHMSGQATTEEMMRDDQFAIETNAIKLKRAVETYQWVEHVDTKKKKKLGGGTRTTKTYRYTEEWKSGHKKSKQFEKPEGHTNVAPHFKDESNTAKHVNVGAYELNSSLIGDINSFEPLPYTNEQLDQLPSDKRDHYLIDDGYVYWSVAGTPDPANPQNGDQRVKFSVVLPTEVSLVAQQVGSSFSPFTVPNGEKIQRLYVGNKTADQMFEALQGENMMMAWLLRALGFALSCGGFFLIFSPLATLADVIPFLGSMTRSIAFVIALLMGTIVACMTIAISWIAVRPLIGIPLVVVSLVAGFMLFRVISKNKRQTPTQPTPLGQDDIPYVPLG